MECRYVFKVFLSNAHGKKATFDVSVVEKEYVLAEVKTNKIVMPIAATLGMNIEKVFLEKIIEKVADKNND